MSAPPWQRVIVVNQTDPATGQEIAVSVEIVNDQPIEVSLTEVANNLTFVVDGRGTANYFFDDDGNAVPVKTAFGAPATSGDNNPIVAAVPGKRIRILSYQLQGKGTVSAHFRSGANPISMTWDFEAREGVIAQFTGDGFYFQTAVGAGLNLHLSAAVGVNVQVQYVEVS